MLCPARQGRNKRREEVDFVIELPRTERDALEARNPRYTSPYRGVVRAKVVLMAAEGLENTMIAAGSNCPSSLGGSVAEKMCLYSGGVGRVSDQGRGDRGDQPAADHLGPGCSCQ